ncbi:MAG TPA: GntR family transcriptional regulator [Vineibacter sp.]|nr:GntR family transcriptional regulator [Vineibacter sp.]
MKDARGLTGPAFVPIYSRILDVLRQRIASGRYRVGEALPTEADLVAEFEVSRHTVRAALQCLVAEGLVERTAGRGTFLKRGGAGGGEWSIGGIEDIIDVGFSGAYDVKSVRYVSARSSMRAATALDVPPRARLLNVSAVRSTREGPFAFSNLYFSEEIGSRLPENLFAERPLILLVEEYCGLPPFRTRQVASAKLADMPSAQVLGVPVGHPLLIAERTHFARNGRALQYSHVEYRTDRYQQVIYFSRRDEGPYRPPKEREAMFRHRDENEGEPGSSEPARRRSPKTGGKASGSHARRATAPASQKPKAGRRAVVS